jgi:predicted heme/steroid binding protein
MKYFTISELAVYNGENGISAYIAFQGKVYDVSDSFLWQDGRHMALHEAGRDLTIDLEKAPHGSEFLERFAVIGFLKISDEIG